MTYATRTKLLEGFTRRKGQIRPFLIGILENRGFGDTFSILLRLQNSPLKQGLNRILLLCTKRVLLLSEYKTVSFTLILSNQYAGHDDMERLTAKVMLCIHYVANSVLQDCENFIL